MPTKGRSRSHEAIDLRPATRPTGTAVATQPPAGAEPEVWRTEPVDGPVRPGAPSVSTYENAQTGVRVTMQDADELRDTLDRRPGVPTRIPTAISVRGPDDDTVVGVGGPALVTPEPDSLRYTVDPGDLLCAEHGSDDCEHRRRAADAVQAVLEARRPRSTDREWQENTSDVPQQLAEEHARSEATRAADDPAPGPEGLPWSEHPDRFQAAYDAARTRAANGEPPIPYLTENATGGLGARDGGRPFGVEIEFDLPNLPLHERQAALDAIGRDLHAAGLTSTPQQTRYHSQVGSPLWRFETDSTVAGEVVSPVLYDEPHTWQQLAQVCDIVRRHGGQATARTGGHVHVGVGDYDHTVENHNNLLGLFAEHEDVLYRLAQNPHRRAHRGTDWCAPNRVTADGYRDVSQVHYHHSGHHLGMNFGSVRGRDTDHVEFRMWDGSLDPAVIQTQVNLSLGMTHAAFRTERGTVWGHEPVGLHRQRNHNVLGRGQRLTGERWRADTASFRRLVDRAFNRDVNREQAAALLAVTRWQRRR